MAKERDADLMAQMLSAPRPAGSACAPRRCRPRPHLSTPVCEFRVSIVAMPAHDTCTCARSVCFARLFKS